MNHPFDRFSLVTLAGAPLPASVYQGKSLLVVNVASRCGLTPQYTGLVALHTEMAANGGAVVGVPCNQFGAQEPGTPEEIQTFCATTYGVDFPLLAKQDVNGATRSALYEYLVHSDAGGGGDIGWNFEKFLVDGDGVVRARFAPTVKPEDTELRAAIAALQAS
jgi:glutathione peroxidase